MKERFFCFAFKDSGAGSCTDFQRIAFKKGLLTCSAQKKLKAASPPPEKLRFPADFIPLYPRISRYIPLP